MNIIAIMSDQHRAISMGAYGSRDVSTPNLDKLANESVVFEHAYCQFPQCVASRQSLLTGQYPSQHGARNIAMQTVNVGQWTVANAFNQAGYDTVHIGKTHCNERGFSDCRNHHDYFDKLPSETRDAVQEPLYGFDYFKNAETAGPCTIPAPHDQEMIEPYVLRETFQFLKEKHDRPFYLTVSFNKPHPPFNPPKKFWDMVDHDKIELPPVDPNRERHPFWPKEIMTHEMIRNYLHGYYASIAYMDWCVGEILDVMREEGYFDNSLISYTSDHGESGAYHGSYEKHCFYESSVHVPLIIRTPDCQPHRVSEIVELIDIPVTYTDLCNVDIGEHIYDGSSLKGLLAGNAENWKNRAISEYYQRVPKEGPVDKDLSFGRMLIKDGFKCCINGNMIAQNSLFNMIDDPQEFINLWDNPEYCDIRNKMVSELNKKWKKEWYNNEA